MLIGVEGERAETKAFGRYARVDGVQLDELYFSWFSLQTQQGQKRVDIKTDFNCTAIALLIDLTCRAKGEEALTESKYELLTSP